MMLMVLWWGGGLVLGARMLWWSGLELEVEADGGFEGAGVLVDGEVVLAEVWGFEEGLAEGGADAEVFGEEGVIDSDVVVVGHAGLGEQALASAGGGAEGGGAG